MGFENCKVGLGKNMNWEIGLVRPRTLIYVTEMPNGKDRQFFSPAICPQLVLPRSKVKTVETFNLLS